MASLAEISNGFNAIFRERSPPPSSPSTPGLPPFGEEVSDTMLDGLIGMTNRRTPLYGHTAPQRGCIVPDPPHVDIDDIQSDACQQTDDEALELDRERIRNVVWYRGVWDVSINKWKTGNAWMDFDMVCAICGSKLRKLRLVNKNELIAEEVRRCEVFEFSSDSREVRIRTTGSLEISGEVNRIIEFYAQQHHVRILAPGESQLGFPIFLVNGKNIARMRKHIRNAAELKVHQRLEGFTMRLKCDKPASDTPEFPVAWIMIDKDLGSLDRSRVLAHELIHVATNRKGINVEELPAYLDEGVAEVGTSLWAQHQPGDEHWQSTRDHRQNHRPPTGERPGLYRSGFLTVHKLRQAFGSYMPLGAILDLFLHKKYPDEVLEDEDSDFDNCRVGR